MITFEAPRDVKFFLLFLSMKKMDEFISFNDLVKLIKTLRADFSSFSLVLASPKGLWKLAQDEGIGYEVACTHVKESGVLRITSSYEETETSLTHSEIKMLYSAASAAGLKTTGKAELACPPTGLPLWGAFIDRLVAIRSIADANSLDVINVEPAKETRLTPIEYLRAVGIARIVLQNVKNVSTPLTRIPSLSPKMGIGTKYTQHPQEKIAGVCLLAGSNDLGLLEEDKVTIASIVEDIRSAGLQPKLRDGGYEIQSYDSANIIDRLIHVPNMVVQKK